MLTFIAIESLAANALIDIWENKHERKVDLNTLVNYGAKISQVLEEQNGDEAVLLMYRKYQLSMKERYSDFFKVEINDPQPVVFHLKDENKIDTIKDYFRWSMRTNELKAFLSKEAAAELGIVK